MSRRRIDSISQAATEVKSRSGLLISVAVAMLVATPICDSPRSASGADREAGRDAPRIHFTATEKRRLLQHRIGTGSIPDPSNGVVLDAKAIELGRVLFFDTRFSANNQVSCATCHQREHAWCDNKELGQGVGLTRRNVPSLFDVANQRWFFWDGRADSLWAQALGPLENLNEHGTDRVSIVRQIVLDSKLKVQYEAVFGQLPDKEVIDTLPYHASPLREPDHADSIAWNAMATSDQLLVNSTFSNVGKAIAAFVSTIKSPPSAFDDFLDGLESDDESQIDSISPAARRGAKLFVGKAGCRNCHSGSSFSDGEFHSIGLAPRSGQDVADSGRLAGIAHLMKDPFNAKGRFSDIDPSSNPIYAIDDLVVDGTKWGQFKTPGLRNVGRTAPYMHDGRFRTLRQVVEYYSTMNGSAALDHHEEMVMVPLKLTETEILDLIAFLESLGETAATK